jgi:hypothetical protein
VNHRGHPLSTAVGPHPRSLHYRKRHPAPIIARPGTPSPRHHPQYHLVDNSLATCGATSTSSSKRSTSATGTLVRARRETDTSSPLTFFPYDNATCHYTLQITYTARFHSLAPVIPRSGISINRYHHLRHPLSITSQMTHSPPLPSLLPAAGHFSFTHCLGPGCKLIVTFICLCSSFGRSGAGQQKDLVRAGRRLEWVLGSMD